MLNGIVQEAAGDDSLPYWLEALLSGYSWGPIGQPATVTIGFPLAPPFGADTEYQAFQSFQINHRAKVWEVLALWENVSGLRFVQAPSPRFADIQFAFYELPAPLAGSANYPGGLGSLVAIDADARTDAFNDEFWYHVLIHEIGHALGLKHPGDYSEDDEPPFLQLVEDSLDVTQLSYYASEGNHAPGVNPNRVLAPYDIAAVQYLYGVNGAINPGDTVYDLFELIWPGSMISDAAGQDTLDASIAVHDNDLTLDLREGAISHWGMPEPLFSHGGQVTINFGSVIENAIGSGGDDLITGNNVDNYLSGASGTDSLAGLGGNDTLVGGPGDDILTGGDGIDLAVYHNPLRDFSLHISDGEVIVAERPGMEAIVDGTDRLAGVERLQFADVNVALDLHGHAGQVARLLGSVLGPELWNDPVYLAIGIDFLDHSGAGIEELTAIAFQELLGESPANGQVLNLLYSAIVGTPPPVEFYDTFVEKMDAGEFSQVELGMAAANHELNLLNIDFVGLLQSGLVYQPDF